MQIKNNIRCSSQLSRCLIQDISEYVTWFISSPESTEEELKEKYVGVNIWLEVLVQCIDKATYKAG